MTNDLGNKDSPASDTCTYLTTLYYLILLFIYIGHGKNQRLDHKALISRVCVTVTATDSHIHIYT